MLAKIIDNYRLEITSKNKLIKNNEKIKILHVTVMKDIMVGFFLTGRRLNNGFVRLNHSVLTLSDEMC